MTSVISGVEQRIMRTQRGNCLFCNWGWRAFVEDSSTEPQR